MNCAVLLKTNYEVPIDSSNAFYPIFYYLSSTLLKAYSLKAVLAQIVKRNRMV